MNEDAYWEHRREEFENPKPHIRGEWGEREEEYKSDTLYLDEEIEDIEAEYKCSMSELYEGDLADVVEKFRNIYPDSAVWEPNYGCITYRYEV